MNRTPLRRLVTCLDGRRIPLNAEERSRLDGTVPYWGANGVVDHVERPLFREPLVLLGEDGAPFDDPLRDVAFCVTEPVWVNNHIHVLRPRSHTDCRYMAYALNTIDWMPHVTGSTRLKLTQDRMMSVRVPSWSLPAQRKIAGFLDRETERIDALMDKKRRLIGLLEEKRTATITHAVTKGLDPTAPMKPTTIPWIETVPGHWEYRRLKHLMVSLVDTEHKTVHFVEDGAYPVVRTSDVRSGRLLLGQARRTDDAGYREWTRRRQPRPGDVMLAREAPAGEACLVPQAPPVCLGQRMVLISPDPTQLLDGYLVYAIYSEPVQIFIELSSQGSTVVHLNMADIPEIPITLPSTQEQGEIVRFLDAQAEHFDTISQALTSQISLLAEYREALITAAVTGEIDVDTFDNDRDLEAVTP